MNFKNRFGYRCCCNRLLSIIASLPRVGYLPGEEISVTLQIDNKRRVAINLVRFILKKILVYKAHHPAPKTRLEEMSIAGASVGPIKAKKSQQFTQKIMIPWIHPSNLHAIIDISYQLKVNIPNAIVYK